MKKTETINCPVKLCNLNYLHSIMHGNTQIITEMVNIIIEQVPFELNSIKRGIKNSDFEMIKSNAHTMKTSVSIMGVTKVLPVLRLIEELAQDEELERIKKQNKILNFVCKKAVAELKMQTVTN